MPLVKDLIEALQKCDPKAQVQVGTMHTEYASSEDSCGCYVNVEDDIQSLKIAPKCKDIVVISGLGHVLREPPKTSAWNSEEDKSTTVIEVG